MRRYTNNAGVPLSLAVYLATDNYDYNSAEKTISVTTLMKPLKQLVLAHRVPQDMSLTEVMALVQSRMGSAIHDAIERSWLNDNHVKALTALGYPQKVIERIRVNPEPGTLKEGEIPVYLEKRTSKAIGGWTVSGKFDFVAEGRVEDFKTTGVFTWINNTKDDDYILQGSIYRWLNPDIITQDRMAIQFLFTDWSTAQARSNPKYPQQRTMEKTYGLKSIQEIEHFILAKLRLIEQYWDAPEDQIPNCTDEELWRSAPVWKYYKNPESAGKAGGRSTKNFDDKQEAYLRKAQDGNVGVVVEVPGKAVACKYCPSFPVCKQAQALIASGDLDL